RSNKSCADTNVHANLDTYRKAEHSQDTDSRARMEQEVNHPPQVHGQLWNTCSSYTAEKTRYRRPDFHQGTLTNDKFPFCLAPHSALYLFLCVLQLTTVNHYSMAIINCALIISRVYDVLQLNVLHTGCLMYQLVDIRDIAVNFHKGNYSEG
ncbi:hypothetical protein CSKR_109780, partial [Clonorchis sinensis]